MTAATLAIADLRLLLAEIGTSRRLLAQLAAEIQTIRAKHPVDISREPLALLAVDLHSYYTKLESLLERLLMSFEGQVPRGESGHVALLRAAFLEVPGIRPAVLDEQLRDALDELRKFRHFFRHAYALDLKAERLASVLTPFQTAHGDIDRNLERFVNFIEETIRQLEA